MLTLLGLFGPYSGAGAPNSVADLVATRAHIMQQQMQRSQALAVEQLRALMEAYKAACQAKGTGPC